MKLLTLFTPRYRLPLVLQSETAECGLACLAMVSGFFGHRMDLGLLRQRFPVSGNGAGVDRLIAVARGLKLLPRALRLEPEELGALQLPAVLHWDMNHFVVLKKAGPRQLVIHDPAVGLRRYTMAEASRHFTGVALELSPAQDFQPVTEQHRHRLTDLFSITRGFVANLIQVFVLSLLLQLLALLTPFYVQLTIDQGLARRDTDLILVVALAFLMIVVAKTVLTWLRGMVLIHFSNQLGFQMVNNVFHHLIRLPLAYFERRHIGDVVSRFGSLQSIRQLVSHEMISVVVDGIFSVVTLVLLYLYSPLLATLVLAFVAMFSVIRIATLPVEHRRRQEQLVAEADQQTVFMENIRSMMVTKVYTAESHRTGLWQSSYAELLNRGVQLGRLQLTVSTMQTLLFGLDHVATIYFGTRLVYGAELSVGQLMAFIFLKQHFIGSVSEMIPRLVELRLLRLQLERVSDITLSTPEFEELDGPLYPPPLQGTVAAVDATFRYPGHDEAVLQDLSVTIRAGECVAVTGPSGCGKSTLLRLLAGLMQPESGHIRVDDLRLADVGPRNYRSRIAAILHGDTLLAGSLRDNIVLNGETPVDEQQLWHCCERAGIAEVIRRLPMGFNTRVGDMGVTLSAGQVQRILLARAIYRRPCILFLDEAMANMGAAQALEILAELRRCVTTLILVTHNPALVRAADREISLPRLAGAGRTVPCPS